MLVGHVTDCCGSIVYRGTHADEREAFDEAEAACEATYPPCGCAGFYTSETGVMVDGRDTLAGGLEAHQRSRSKPR